MKKGALVFFIYCGITAALTYPLILQLDSVLPHDAGDPALNTWILWWNTQTMPFSSAWWNPPVFFPAPGVLSFSENLLGLSLVSTPLSWLGAGPQTAYNVVFLLTFPLSALGGYLLGFELTRRHDAAFIAGLLFGFAPYRIAHMPQVQGLASFPMPFALLGLHRYLHDPRPKWLALFAGGWLLQGLCNGYYLLFFSVFVGLWILWFASPLSRHRQFLAIGIAWAAAGVLILPLLLRYRSIHASFGFSRDLATIREFSADVASVLFATGHLKFWGWLQIFRRPEGELFPGLTIALLVLAGALFVRDRSTPVVKRWTSARRGLLLLTVAAAAVAASAMVVGPWRLAPFGVQLLSVSTPMKPLTVAVVLALALALASPGLRQAYAARSAIAFHAVAGFVMWLLSLGPTPTLMGEPLMYRGPYAALTYLPGFSSLRVPARFWMMAILCLAVVGALVFARLTEKLGRWRLAAAVIVSLGVLADTWMAAMPLVETPKPFAVMSCATGDSGPIAEFPLGQTYPDVAAMYRQMSHRRPLMNGYSGYFPPHYTALQRGLSLRDPDVLTQLATFGVTTAIVDREADSDGGWDAYLKAHPTVSHICTMGRQSLYRITKPARAEATAAAGIPVAAALIQANVNPAMTLLMVDGDLTTRWESGPQEQGMRVDVDLGAVRTVQGVDLWLGRFVEDFPRGMVIEASEDGQSWRELWRGSSAGLAVVSSFDLGGSVPMRYRFEPTQARIIRMRLTADDPIYFWSIAEMKIIGP
ncbi:MAG TPA: discoidin domain-containing protein [Vicinamibacterales bacterium]|nr:discoidin domain-containing protein [Vicinamibacterales bacterium]